MFGGRVTFTSFFSFLKEPLLRNLCCSFKSEMARPPCSAPPGREAAAAGGLGRGARRGAASSLVAGVAGRPLIGQAACLSRQRVSQVAPWALRRFPRASGGPAAPPASIRSSPALLGQRSGSAPLRVRDTRPVPVGRSATGHPRAGKSSPTSAGRGGAARAGGAEGGAGLRAAACRSRGAAGPGSTGGGGGRSLERQPWAGRHKGSVTRLPERRRSPGNRPLPLYPGASPGWGRGGAGVPAGACPRCPGARSRRRSRSYAGCGRRARSTVGPGGRPLRAAGGVPASASRPRRRCPGAP